jgi:hypothetical protein
MTESRGLGSSPPVTRQTLIRQVTANCEIGNAGQAGYFSLCGLLLRLRQLYKWEHGLPPWREPDPGDVLAWVEAKERAWEELEGASWQDLDWGGAALDPFQVEEINAACLPQGLAYGAGYSRGLAPTCFLGELVEVRRLEDLTVLVLGAELARDLDAAPALTQGSLIYVRKQALAYYLWDRLSDPVQQDKPFLKLALSAYGTTLPALLQDPEGSRAVFDALVAGEMEAVVRHEVGEAREPGFRETFRTAVALFPQTRLELWVRALKDALAEVNDWGRLSYIIEARQLPSLAFMLAWRPGLYPLLLPELEPAFWELQAGAGWEVLEEARQCALARLRRVAGELNDLLLSGNGLPPEELRREIEARFLQPLGL